MIISIFVYAIKYYLLRTNPEVKVYNVTQFVCVKSIIAFIIIMIISIFVYAIKYYLLRSNPKIKVHNVTQFVCVKSIAFTIIIIISILVYGIKYYLLRTHTEVKVYNITQFVRVAFNIWHYNYHNNRLTVPSPSAAYFVCFMFYVF